MDISLSVVLATLPLYVVIPGYLLFFKGWPLRAGIAMFVIALIPLSWQVNFTDSEAMGFGILLMMMLPLPLLLIGIGVVASLIRMARHHRGANHSPS